MPVIRWIEEVYNMVLRKLEFVPYCFKTQGMCNEAVCIEPCSLAFVSDHFEKEQM